jgi:hypothetical protein
VFVSVGFLALEAVLWALLPPRAPHRRTSRAMKKRRKQHPRTLVSPHTTLPEASVEAARRAGASEICGRPPPLVGGGARGVRPRDDEARGFASRTQYPLATLRFHVHLTICPQWVWLPSDRQRDPTPSLGCRVASLWCHSAKPMQSASCS